MIVHTGQHFDANMSDVFPTSWKSPRPHHHLGIGGGPHGAMTGRMRGGDRTGAAAGQTAVMLVYGDTSSNLVGALAAPKLHIHARGHEIGLHPSYGSYLDPARIAEEAARLRSVCAEEHVDQISFGRRMHYLQWRQPDTLRAWDAAGMAYDSTMTYADHAGFRCGTCFNYPAFDPVAQQPLKLRIRPLVVMEGSVFGKNYMNLGVTDAAQAKMLELKDACRKVSGCFTLLWHNSSFQTRRHFAMYEAVLAA